MSEGLLDLIQRTAGSEGIDWRLVYAVIRAESRFEPWACRYEPAWPEKWLVTPDVFAKALGQSYQTEIIQQKTSWGAMQIMGAVARELGFKYHLTQLCLPEHGIFWGCKKLKSCLVKYPATNDAVAAYNAGSPRKQPDGRYVNEGYLIKVLAGIQETSKIAEK